MSPIREIIGRATADAALGLRGASEAADRAAMEVEAWHTQELTKLERKMNAVRAMAVNEAIEAAQGFRDAITRPRPGVRPRPE